MLLFSHNYVMLHLTRDIRIRQYSMWPMTTNGVAILFVPAKNFTERTSCVEYYGKLAYNPASVRNKVIEISKAYSRSISKFVTDRHIVLRKVG